MVIFGTQTTLNSLTVGACFDCKSSFLYMLGGIYEGTVISRD